MGSVDNANNTATASSSTDKKPSRSIIIRNFPTSATKEEIDQLLAKFGTVKKCKQVSVKVTVKVADESGSAAAGEHSQGSGEGGQSSEARVENRMETYLNVTYETADMAQMAMQHLSNYELHGIPLNVEFQNHSGGRQGQSGGRNPGRGGSRSMAPRQDAGAKRPSNNTYPLRILVPGPVVGAVIGRKGETIRNITTNCKTRVDVHGKENAGLLEKVISIFGQPENCSSACKEILKIVEQEMSASAAPNTKNATVLRMLMDERYCGRIIGKEGRFIKKIREETETKISVANPQEAAHLFPETVITIRGGSIDSVVKAQAALSSRLVECLEREAAQLQQNAMGGPGSAMMGPYSQMPPAGPGLYNPMHNSKNGYYNQGPYMYGSGGPGSVPAVGGAYYGGGGATHSNELVMITVPNSAVGAIIGAGGTIIKQLMQDSNARISVETKTDQESGNQSQDRVVMIKGSSEACWKASYYIFEKMKQEGVDYTAPPTDDSAHPQYSTAVSSGESVRLKTAIKIPHSAVGRVIGKSGRNIREIQRITGSYIKLPEEQSQQGEEVLVEVTGTFMSTQIAHNRIRALVSETAGQGSYDDLPSRGGQRGAGAAGSRRPPPQTVEAH